MSATLSMATLPTAAAAVSLVRSPRRKMGKVTYIAGLGSYNGLRRHDKVSSMGLLVCPNYRLFKIVNSARSSGKGRSGGAWSAVCSAGAEIFKIAAIMNGLVLVGVAVGFVLLRIEASVEESE